MLHSRIAWIDFYSSAQPTPINKQTYTSGFSTSSQSVYISNSLFKSITSSSQGGALCCSTSVEYLLIESTSFFSCKTSGQRGGAIYFTNQNNGQCVLYEVCGYDCCTTYTSDSSYGQFVYSRMRSITSCKNHVNYSSISCCVSENSNSCCMVFHDYGSIFYLSTNVSMNKCNRYSGVYSFPTSDSNSITSSLTFCTIADNIATGYNCIYFETGGAKYEIKSCNIIRNTQVSGSYGTIYTWGNTNIDDSCILENSATYIFYASSSYTITLSNCTVDSTTRYGSLIIQRTATKSFILALNHMFTANCHSGYDSAGTLTPIVQSSCPSNNPVHLYTFNKCDNNKARISEFFSLNCVFMVTFIHANSS
jgi:hypothetical protein